MPLLIWNGFMDIKQKNRLRSLLIKSGALLGIGLLYAIFWMITGIGIPCVFHLITGKYCPGCGISRMFISLLHLDFVSAAKYNILALSLLPCALLLFICKSVEYVKTGESKMGRLEMIFYCICFVLCIAFYFLRNSGIIPFISL